MGRKPARPAVECRVKVTFPASSWLYRLTSGHPERRIDVLDRFPLSDGLVLTEARIHGVRGRELSEEIERVPVVRQIETLLEGRSSTHLRVVHRTPEGMALFRDLRITRPFPFRVENGATTWRILTSDEKLRRLLDGLSKVVSRIEVQAVRRGPSDPVRGLLTDRQKVLFGEAMREGYFDVPRRTSLTGLAGHLGLSKSSLSKTLAIIEKKLLSSTDL